MTVVSSSIVDSISDSMEVSLESGSLMYAAGSRLRTRGARMLAGTPAKRSRLCRRVVGKIADKLESGRVTLDMDASDVRQQLSFGLLESWLLSALLDLLVSWAWSLFQSQLFSGSAAFDSPPR